MLSWGGMEGVKAKGSTGNLGTGGTDSFHMKGVDRRIKTVITVLAPHIVASYRQYFIPTDVQHLALSQ